MSVAIEVAALGKRYVRPVAGDARYGTLRDSVAGRAAKFLRGSRGATARKEEFWALKDISFRIDEGEIVGIIGRNGAGKSTLLKILSRITAPTSGEARLRGRVGSLLEVGTGFHPELSGRENIFMNGAILGMSRGEIRKKFDEILDFSGVAEFIDMPVKRYSSGMHARLAFAVAAHLEPEIMIVDEVLAVGDADFQKKCLGKMKDVAGHGRTVLFVSHNMNAVNQLCSRVIWLQSGRTVLDNRNVHAATNRYLFGEQEDGLKGIWQVPPDEPLETAYFNLRSFSLRDEAGGVVTSAVRGDQRLTVEISVQVRAIPPSLNFGYAVINEEGKHVYWTTTTDESQQLWPAITPGDLTLTSEIPARLLNEGLYRVDLFASLHAKGYFSEPGNTIHSITLRVAGGLSDSPYWREARPGVVAPVLRWDVERR